MEVYLTGINYSRTPATIREKVASGIGLMEEALLPLSKYLAQGVILATCNRTEIYTVADNSDPPELATINFLQNQTGLSEAELLPHIYVYHHESAIKHLFSVASGLDSMLIGEFEVLGQVNRALEAAEKRHLVSWPLHRLFRRAIQTGRHVRNETGISRSALSVSSVAVELAAKTVGNIGQARVLVIGAGEAGQLVTKAAKERGASQVAIATRHQEKVSPMATMLGGRLVSMDNLDEELIAADIVISCTATPHFVLSYAQMVEMMKARPQRPLVIIDIAVPRDVEPEVKKINSIFLYDIDDFTKVAEANRQQRRGEVQQALELIDDEARRFIDWWQGLEVRPIISVLVDKAEKIRQAQLNLTLKKLPNLSDEERTNLETMTKSLVQKILHEPIQYLKGNKNEEEAIKLMKKLFGLDKEG